MGYALDIFAAFLSGGTLERDQIPSHLLGAAHCDAVRAHLLERYEERTPRGRSRSNPISVNARLAAWRQVLRHAWDKGLMTAENFQRAANAPHLPGHRERKRRFVAEEALAQLFRYCALDPNRAAGARDAALLALYFGCGMRRFEALSLFPDDIDMREDGWRVAVIGKRNKERSLGIPIGAAGFMCSWLALRGWSAGPLLYPVLKNGAIQPQEQPMNIKVGNNIVARRLLEAGIPWFSPHDLRATWRAPARAAAVWAGRRLSRSLASSVRKRSSSARSASPLSSACAQHSSSARRSATSGRSAASSAACC